VLADLAARLAPRVPRVAARRVERVVARERIQRLLLGLAAQPSRPEVLVRVKGHQRARGPGPAPAGPSDRAVPPGRDPLRPDHVPDRHVTHEIPERVGHQAPVDPLQALQHVR